MLMDKLNSRRINYIDFLKFIGLTGIFAAHVGSPKWLMMLRNFDVPFMVIYLLYWHTNLMTDIMPIVVLQWAIRSID